MMNKLDGKVGDGKVGGTYAEVSEALVVVESVADQEAIRCFEADICVGEDPGKKL